MRIEYSHASKFGNGAMVAAEFEKLMATKGVGVEVHHIREVNPAELSSADLYVFSSPGRFGNRLAACAASEERGTCPRAPVRRLDDRGGTQT